MHHIDPDDLAIIALGETTGMDDQLGHLADCPTCASEVEILARAARVGRSTLDAELLVPSPRVWERIVAEVADAAPAPAAVTPLRRRSWIPLVIAAALAVILGAGGIATWQMLRPVSSVVLASATLDAFPDWPGARGEALVEESPDGARVVRLDIDVPEERNGYTEVWLITSDATKLVSLGTVQGTSGVFPIPDGIDISEYDLVDVSAEPLDGDPAHSGDSIVRGQLTIS
ncbi:hypothetical protein M2152_000844 [Microbacteriaceae bacterium SG_E_30_P1]|uniref:Anti-sigma K factor RskA C-terminal domain-containing protein n=1 Tax=Antiquaquibacter oligotrophicus TaxID=2880260 RepID=A0ABT6KNF7_9MICO|nr:anti-sigma factor [Antiquaquibacter oligotrophicus]MDH6180662.1 hypothetical protein [Antiquaquibacter oligotrophicus]UDF13610.1 anti-sigma factor [Antiquaquibacter oligotrophicus]